MHLQYTPADLEHFWSKVDRSGDCWLWLCGLDADGYGQHRLSGYGKIKAHRFACYVQDGPPSAGKPLALHTCNEPACQRGGHLYWGTNQDNARDMVSSGHARGGCRISEHARLAKLTVDQIRAIRARWMHGDITQKDLGALYGITQPTVSQIVLRKIWRQV